MTSPLVSANDSLAIWLKTANLWEKNNNYIPENANMLDELMTLSGSLSKKKAE